MQGEHSISAPPMPVARQFTIVAIFFFVGLAFYLNTMRVKDAPVVRTMGIKVLAESVRQTGGEDCPLTYVDGPFALQFYLNTKRPEVSFEQAAALLRSNTAAYVVVRDYEKLQGLLGVNSVRLNELARWPDSGKAYVRIVSNRPQWERSQ